MNKLTPRELVSWSKTRVSAIIGKVDEAASCGESSRLRDPNQVGQGFQNERSIQEAISRLSIASLGDELQKRALVVSKVDLASRVHSDLRGLQELTGVHGHYCEFEILHARKRSWKAKITPAELLQPLSDMLPNVESPDFVGDLDWWGVAVSNVERAHDANNDGLSNNTELSLQKLEDTL